ncbi:hypothetical protein LOTGIDRAFT_161082 [Lottia gigantea]|uniref:G-protein coupled receptors family 1 profile domain-containing protein n=1 Tax=Lottia gigantea TaxID=225164 RepID=V4AJG7_LOTGI|nr:hypothetical protein LOTGIDRAFT_161082 [Lottia gigantea]ESO94830.1 hypothetical protein LOTGIDRAFT_161082 [Lottia gigantea]
MANESHLCFKWLKHDNSTTIEDLNDQFTLRHLGGIIFTAVLMIFGFFGNIMVLWIYIRRFKPSTYRIYTVCLALMDIGNCCTGMPFLIYYMSHYLIFPSAALCQFGRFMIMFTTNCSAYILIVIAFDRFRKVCRPLKWQMSHKHAALCCIIAGCTSLIVSWPTLVVYGNHTMETVVENLPGLRCWTKDPLVDTSYPSAYFITVCVMMVTVMVVLFVAYINILRFLHRHKTTGINIKTKSTTITLLAVTAAFLLSAIPYYSMVIALLILTRLNCDMTFSEGFAYYTIVFSILLNHAVNPFIYGFLDKKFRREVWSMFKKGDGKEDMTTSGSKFDGSVNKIDQ